MPQLFSRDVVSPIFQSKGRLSTFAPDQDKVFRSVNPGASLQWPTRNFIPPGQSIEGPRVSPFGGSRNPFSFSGEDGTSRTRVDILNGSLHTESLDGNRTLDVSPFGAAYNFPIGEKGAAKIAGSWGMDPGISATFTTNTERYPQPFYNPIDSLFSNSTNPDRQIFETGFLPSSDYLPPNTINDSAINPPVYGQVGSEENEAQLFLKRQMEDLIQQNPDAWRSESGI